MSTRYSSWVKVAGAFGWRSTTLVVPKVEMIWGLNLPGTPRATSACCGRPLFNLYIYNMYMLYIFYIYIYLIYNLDHPWWTNDVTEMWTDNFEQATQIYFLRHSRPICNSTLYFRLEYWCEDYHGSLMIIFYQATRLHGPERSNLVTVIMTSHFKVRDCWQFPFILRNFCSWCRIIKWHKIDELCIVCVWTKRKKFLGKNWSNVVKSDKRILKLQGCDVEKDSNDQNVIDTCLQISC
jgi:hypothetical protein